MAPHTLTLTEYMRADDATVTTQVNALAARLTTKHGADVATDTAAVRAAPTWLEGAELLSLRLHEQFPGDIGMFAPFMLNHVVISPGEAFFMAANEPHAYLSGDTIEVMAGSDNVVRAGLTPKLKDVPTLTAMLTYNTGAPPVTSGHALSAHVRRFTPPVPDFAVERVAVPPGTTLELPGQPGAAICLVVSGSASDGERAWASGSAALQPAGVTVSLTASGDSECLLFRAFPNA